MHATLNYALLGLGAGATYAFVGLGLVLTYRAAGILNFAQGAFAAWTAYTYAKLVSTGSLILPVGSIHLGAGAQHVDVAIALAIVETIILALITYVLVVKPLRTASPVATIVATVGLAIILEAILIIRFGTEPQTVDPILPSNALHTFGLIIPVDRLYLTGLAIAITAGLTFLYRKTRFGLATRASAESPVVSESLGYSPDVLIATNWVMAAVLAGVAGILVAPLLGLDPTTQTELLVSGFAVALIGRLESFIFVCLGGLVLGILQSELVRLGGISGIPSGVTTGDDAILLFIIIGLVLFLTGKRLPTRADVNLARLPAAPLARHPLAFGIGIVAVGSLATWVLHGEYRLALITTLVSVPILLSIVVLTGFLGQISLLQGTLAGVGGFAVAKLSVNYGIGFPWSFILAGLAAAIVGVVVGVPALRVRGLQLAIMTLAAGLALESGPFQDAFLIGTNGQPSVGSPHLFGWNLGIYGSGGYPRVAFGITVAVIVGLCCWGVGHLRKSATGRQMLAIRSNERAAAAAGIRVVRTKLIGSGLAGFLAGIGGALFGYLFVALSYTSFTTDASVQFLAVTYLGGITTVAGALVAALFTSGSIVVASLNNLIPGFNDYAFLISGIGVTLTAVLNPDGISGATRKGLTIVTDRWQRSHHDVAPTVRTASVIADVVAPREARAFDTSVPALDITDLTVRFGATVANAHIDLRVEAGEVVGLIGPNGAGKTTLIDAISGLVESQGTVKVGPVDMAGKKASARAQAGLRRTFQAVELFDDLDIVSNLAVACAPQSRESRPAPPGRSWLQTRFAARQQEDTATASAYLERIGMGAYSHLLPEALSHGDQRMIGVVRAAISDPVVLVLDEPAAGLSQSERDSLMSLVREFGRDGMGVLLVEHDMRLVLSTCDRIYVLVNGEILMQGTPDEVRRDARVIEAYLGLRSAVDADPPDEGTDEEGPRVGPVTLPRPAATSGPVAGGSDNAVRLGDSA